MAIVSTPEMRHARMVGFGAVAFTAACDVAPALDVIPTAAVQTATGPITIDGEWNEPDWDMRTTPMVFAGNDGDEARPYSEIRFLRDDANVYVGLYAADEDIEPTDFFQVGLGEIDIRVDPEGHVDASIPGIIAASNVDGTIDDPTDNDEEWVIELAVPLTATTLDPTVATAMAASRCDVTKDTVLRCGRTSGELVAHDPSR